MRKPLLALIGLISISCGTNGGLPGISPTASPSPGPSPSPVAVVSALEFEPLEEAKSDSIGSLKCNKGFVATGGGCECKIGSFLYLQYVNQEGVLCGCSSGNARVSVICLKINSGEITLNQSRIGGESLEEREERIRQRAL